MMGRIARASLALLLATVAIPLAAQPAAQETVPPTGGIVTVNDRAIPIRLRVSGDIAILALTLPDGRDVPYVSIATVDDAVAILADRRMAFAWPALLTWAGSDLTGLRERALAKAKQADELGVVATQPRSQSERFSDSGGTTATLQYARALVAAGQFGEGMAILRRRIAESRTADTAYDRDGYATQLLSVRLASELFDHGDEAAGLAMLDSLATDQSIAPEYRLNVAVNRALLDARAGRSAQALALVTAAQKTYRGDQLPADGEAIHIPDSEANFAWIEACALDGLGRHDEARARMAQIASRPGEGALSSTTQKARIWGFLCMRDASGLAREFGAQLATAAPGGELFAIMQPLSAPRPADQDTIRRALAEPALATIVADRVRQLPPDLQPAVSGWRAAPIALDAKATRR